MQSLAKPHRSTRNDHVHRNARLGSRRSAAQKWRPRAAASGSATQSHHPGSRSSARPGIWREGSVRFVGGAANTDLFTLAVRHLVHRCFGGRFEFVCVARAEVTSRFLLDDAALFRIHVLNNIVGFLGPNCQCRRGEAPDQDTGQYELDLIVLSFLLRQCEAALGGSERPTRRALLRPIGTDAIVVVDLGFVRSFRPSSAVHPHCRREPLRVDACRG